MWLKAMKDTNKKTNSYYQRTSLMTLEQNKIRTPYQVCFSKISLILNQVKTEHQSLGLSVDEKKLNSKIQNSKVWVPPPREFYKVEASCETRVTAPSGFLACLSPLVFTPGSWGSRDWVTHTGHHLFGG